METPLFDFGSNPSQWGSEDKAVIDALQHTPVHGNWLNLAAGDGRYLQYILLGADSVTAVDIDDKALQLLKTNIPIRAHHKLITEVYDMTHGLRDGDASYDGVFCTGTLHLFSPKTLFALCREIKRVLRPGGVFLFDFAFDVQRVLPNGELYIHDGEPQYKRDEALGLVPELLDGWQFELIESIVPEQEVKEHNIRYQFSCLYAVVVAYNKKNK